MESVFFAYISSRQTCKHINKSYSIVSDSLLITLSFNKWHFNALGKSQFYNRIATGVELLEILQLTLYFMEGRKGHNSVLLFYL